MSWRTSFSRQRPSLILVLRPFAENAPTLAPSGDALDNEGRRSKLEVFSTLLMRSDVYCALVRPGIHDVEEEFEWLSEHRGASCAFAMRTCTVDKRLRGSIRRELHGSAHAQGRAHGPHPRRRVCLSARLHWLSTGFLPKRRSIRRIQATLRPYQSARPSLAHAQLCVGTRGPSLLTTWASEDASVITRCSKAAPRRRVGCQAGARCRAHSDAACKLEA